MRRAGTVFVASILVLTCVSATSYQGCDWSGLWRTDYGEIIFQQYDNSVNGSYTYWGEVGEISGTALRNHLVGNWTQTDSSGTLEFTITDDCDSFAGFWRYGNSGEWEGSWNGTRISLQQLIQEEEDLQNMLDKINQSIQEEMEESDRRISAAFRAGKITFSWDILYLLRKL